MASHWTPHMPTLWQKNSSIMGCPKLELGVQNGPTWSESASNDRDDPRNAWNQVIFTKFSHFHWLFGAKILLARGWRVRSKLAKMAVAHISEISQKMYVSKYVVIAASAA